MRRATVQRAALAVGGAENCNACPWGGAWAWNPSRVVGILFVAGVIGGRVSGRDHEGLTLLAWVLGSHGASAAWRLLPEIHPRACGGMSGYLFARLALLAAGALDVPAAIGGRVSVIRREDVLHAAACVLRDAGCPREVIAGELAELLRAWSMATADEDVECALRRVRGLDVGVKR